MSDVTESLKVTKTVAARVNALKACLHFVESGKTSEQATPARCKVYYAKYEQVSLYWATDTYRLVIIGFDGSGAGLGRDVVLDLAANVPDDLDVYEILGRDVKVALKGVKSRSVDIEMHQAWGGAWRVESLAKLFRQTPEGGSRQVFGAGYLSAVAAAFDAFNGGAVELDPFGGRSVPQVMHACGNGGGGGMVAALMPVRVPA